jgi:multidrug resistance protein, MATE family
MSEMLKFESSMRDLSIYSSLKSRVSAEIRDCLLLAVPLAGAQLAHAATTFIDTVMMGVLGSQALAAGGLGAAIFLASLLAGTGIVSAVSPLAAEAYGAGKIEQVGRVVRQGLWLAVAIALPVTIMIWNGDVILRLVGQQPENIAAASGYLQAIAWGYLPGLCFAVLKNFASALSRPRPVIIVMVCGTAFNAIANYVLMFGKLGLPALGLTGIGIASALSLWGMFVALLIYLMSQPAFRPYGLFRNLQQFDRRVFWELVQTGVPIGVLAAVETGLFTATTFIVGQIGTTTLAAHQIALQTASITFMVPLGVSFATTVRVGQFNGQQNPSGARIAGYVGIGIGSLFMGIMAILFWVMPETIISLYLDVQDPANREVVAIAKSLLGVAAMFQLVDGIQVIAAGALRGLKDTRIPMFIGILAYWFLGLGSSYLLGLQLGFGGIGLWWGLAIGLAAAAVILTWRFHYLITPAVRAQICSYAD